MFSERQDLEASYILQNDKTIFTPAQDAQSVDHGGVRVCSHYTVWVDGAAADLNHPGQILQVHLVDSTNVRRNHVHILKCFRTPLFWEQNEKC